MRISLVFLGAAALALGGADAAAQQQPRESRERRQPSPRVERRTPEPLVRVFGAALDPDRAVIGVSLGESGTRGIRVADVAEDGPAARAGIKAGDHLTAVGDVSLRLDADDAEDPVLRTAPERRLRRALERLDAGDEVTLRVATGDAERTVRVRTVRADSLEPARTTVARALPSRLRGDRASLGLSLAGTGTARDTLGAFVVAVAPGGPAERAGIVEGARIAAVNGVDLRVDRADAGDRAISAAMARRLERALDSLTAGAEVTLRVWDDGRYRDVRVRTAKASEVYEDGMPWGMGGLRGGPGAFAFPEGPAIWLGPEGDRFHFEVLPRGRIFELDPDVRIELDDLDELSPEIRARVERGLREARTRAAEARRRATEARVRAARLSGRWTTI